MLFRSADLKGKDDLIEILEIQAVETMDRQGDLFSPKPQSDADYPFLIQVIGRRLPSDMWKQTRG